MVTANGLSDVMVEAINALVDATEREGLKSTIVHVGADGLQVATLYRRDGTSSYYMMIDGALHERHSEIGDAGGSA